MPRVEPVVSTTYDVERLLARIDIGAFPLVWKWEVNRIGVEGDLGWVAGDVGWLMRVGCHRAEHDEFAFGRLWFLPPRAPETLIVRSALAAARDVLDMLLLAGFRLDGVRVFDPCHTMADLRVAAVHNASS